MVKPLEFEDVVHMGQFLTKYWLGMSKVPESSRPPARTQQQPKGTKGDKASSRIVNSGAK
jgi:hypothetical protein